MWFFAKRLSSGQAGPALNRHRINGSCRSMNRHTEQQLLNFCVAQHGRFNPQAWESLDSVSPDYKACAMLLLANARWYGREQEMRELVGAPTRPQAAGRLSELASRAGFNCSRFAQRLQARLWSSTEPKR